jgi:HPt (histidine-containing phosphotransfer) domain-containing protein
MLSASEILDRFDGDAELAAAVIDAFLEEVPRLMSDIGDAIARGDAPALRRAAHTVKGSIGHFSAGGQDLAAKLEGAGSSAEIAAAARTCSALEAELARLKPLLETIRRDLNAD